MKAVFWSCVTFILLIIAMTDSIVTKTVKIAVNKGKKFAYPKGVKLKYENVCFILSLGPEEKIKTAPYGKISKIRVAANMIREIIPDKYLEILMAFSSILYT